MAQILVSGTSLLGPYHAQMHNIYTIDQNAPNSVLYVAGTTGYIGINTIIAGTQPSAILHLIAGTTGVLPSAFIPPVMSTANKNAISNPVIGMMVYDNNLNGVCIYSGATTPTWKLISAS